jgi:hypothetical protein
MCIRVQSVFHPWLKHFLRKFTIQLCAFAPSRLILSEVLTVKDTLRSTVNLTFDGRVVKSYHGPNARERFDNEVKVLRFLEEQRCKFVPRVLEADPVEIKIITTSCGSRVERIDDQRLHELLAELESYGVHHDDPDPRNVTYRQTDGRFCLVDFELATILPAKTPKRKPQQ